jgi:large subunit ribosomal protein L18
LNKKRIRRAIRNRARILGTAERPRLSVFRSNKFVYAQLIDDTTGKTLASFSSRSIEGKGAKTDKARAVGEGIAKKAVAQKIEQAVFDRGNYRFHGRVKAVAESAKKAGLKI